MPGLPDDPKIHRYPVSTGANSCLKFKQLLALEIDFSTGFPQERSPLVLRNRRSNAPMVPKTKMPLPGYARKKAGTTAPHAVSRLAQNQAANRSGPSNQLAISARAIRPSRHYGRQQTAIVGFPQPAASYPCSMVPPNSSTMPPSTCAASLKRPTGDMHSRPHHRLCGQELLRRLPAGS